MKFLNSLVLLAGVVSGVLVAYFFGHALTLWVVGESAAAKPWFLLAGGALVASAVLIFVHTRWAKRSSSGGDAGAG